MDIFYIRILIYIITIAQMTDISNSKAVDKPTHFYSIFNTNEHEIIHTKQNINVYLSNNKLRNKTNTRLQTILQGKYDYTLLESINLPTDKKRNCIKTIYDKHCFNETKKRLIAANLKYGKDQEYIVLNLINIFFQNDMIQMCSNPYSHADYYGLMSQSTYELKSNYDKFQDYPNAIIGIEKIIPNTRQIFLFQFKNIAGNNDLYYFIKPDNFSTEFHIREIYLKHRDKYNSVYDIPRTLLKKVDNNNCINLPIPESNSNEEQRIRNMGIF